MLAVPPWLIPDMGTHSVPLTQVIRSGLLLGSADGLKVVNHHSSGSFSASDLSVQWPWWRVLRMTDGNFEFVLIIPRQNPLSREFGKFFLITCLSQENEQRLFCHFLQDGTIKIRIFCDNPLFPLPSWIKSRYNGMRKKIEGDASSWKKSSTSSLSLSCWWWA